MGGREGLASAQERKARAGPGPRRVSPPASVSSFFSSSGPMSVRPAPGGSVVSLLASTSARSFPMSFFPAPPFLPQPHVSCFPPSPSVFLSIFFLHPHLASPHRTAFKYFLSTTTAPKSINILHGRCAGAPLQPKNAFYSGLSTSSNKPPSRSGTTTRLSSSTPSFFHVPFTRISSSSLIHVIRRPAKVVPRFVSSEWVCTTRPFASL
jgi:hypothetical protein